MTVPQPIFEVVAAPELAVWNQAAIIAFIRERRQYETKIAERCSSTGEVPETVARSIRTSSKPRCVADAMILAEMKRKVGGMVIDRVPDVSRLFAELKMDLDEVDVEARIAKYFMGVDRLVEDNGLTGILDRGPAVDEAGRQRMKMRCKLLLKHITPEIFKTDLTRMVELNHRETKADDHALHDLMIERATRQQQYYLKQSEIGQNATLRPMRTAQIAQPTCKAIGQTTEYPRWWPEYPGRPEISSQRVPDCPTATAEQKANVENTLREKRSSPQERVKRIAADVKPAFRSAVINGVLDVPFCPDTTSDVNNIAVMFIPKHFSEDLDRFKTLRQMLLKE
ncbi:Hypothetical protein PHPALM_13904 [Phytophthora palmivora]|uniref:Uncharacterized protein n=1 Tax=Phytophthora palmivora TaxID=4796 RepID=A0A2P4XW45_9STRA|nr:Hypothetical protein PHPALM_13904 [Phytophthora palmivora]